jgi:hypothetical protein
VRAASCLAPCDSPENRRPWSALLVVSRRRLPRWIQIRHRSRRQRGSRRRGGRRRLRRRRGDLRARRGARSRDAIRRRQACTPGLSGSAARDRRCGGALRGRSYGIAGRGRGCGGAGRGCGGAGRLLDKSHRAVASAHSGRNSEQTREHENRERCRRHDGCAHETRAHDKGLAHRGACLVVTRRAALRP